MSSTPAPHAEPSPESRLASHLDAAVAARLKRDPAGLVAAIVQQYDSGEVLMLAWMDDEALARTLSTGRATYWSRSRRQYWVKGETSGNVQRVKSVALDCDGDALLVKVDQTGVACHTGARSCFDGGVIGSDAIDGDAIGSSVSDSAASDSAASDSAASGVTASDGGAA